MDLAIWIEKIIEDIISHHFCPEEHRRHLFMSLIMNEMNISFRSKISTLEKLLKLCYPDLLRKYPKIIDEINKVRKFRNIIAHSFLDNSDEFLKKKFTDRIWLVYFKDGKKMRHAETVAENKNRLVASSQVAFDLVKIQEEVRKRVSSNRKR